MRHLIIILFLIPNLAFADQGLCPQGTQKIYQDTFLECLNRTKTEVQGAKYQGLSDVVSACSDAAKEISGILRNGYYQCYLIKDAK